MIIIIKSVLRPVASFFFVVFRIADLDFLHTITKFFAPKEKNTFFREVDTSEITEYLKELGLNNTNTIRFEVLI